ncbi:hypothetical protein ACSYDW_08625 [Paeniglutamicibacter sp. R2-26]|uniref:hypothetical protein n=1 Tax=Paeniglutamicibacter sp. R2-26 TaxID=3144417 RepID=UPI003EE6AF48
MNPQERRFSAARRTQVRSVLVNEISRAQCRPRRHRKPLVLVSAGALVFAATGSAYYIASKPVEDKAMIRCYYNADLTASRFVPGKEGDAEDPGYQLYPYMGAGIEPKPGESDQVKDAVALCADSWDSGMMNPEGITDHLVPEGFPQPPPGLNSGKIYRDEYGQLYTPPEESGLGPGHYVPELTACVVDDEVAIIPGDKSVCARLQIPALEN